jgi:hypothetical protein
MTLSEANPFDYDADARNRIWRLLEINDIAWRDQLKQSADTAGAQLEWAKPSIMGGHPIYAGPAVMAPLGTIFIVLAHRKKVFVIHTSRACNCRGYYAGYRLCREEQGDRG